MFVLLMPSSCAGDCSAAVRAIMMAWISSGDKLSVDVISQASKCDEISLSGTGGGGTKSSSKREDDEKEL